MDFIIEVFFELFLEGFVSYSKSKKAPKIFRYFVLFFLWAVSAFLLYSTYLLRDEIFIMLFMGLLSIIVIGYTIKLKAYYKKV